MSLPRSSNFDLYWLLFNDIVIVFKQNSLVLRKVFYSSMKKYLSLFACVIFLTTACQSKKETTENKQADSPYLLIGTYTKRGSDGIYVYKFNEETGDFDSVSVATDVEDPSFLTIAPDKKHVYSVCETDGGSVVAFSFDNGKLTELNRAASGGAHPCYITTDHTGKWLFTGNYTGGSVGVLPILADGKVGEPIQIIQHEGNGPNAERQEKAHVHSVNVSPNNHDIFVPDLGIDKVMAYRLDEQTGKLTEGKSMVVSAGSGPRHFAFHPNGKYAYVIQELTGKITAFAYQDSVLTQIEEVSTLPKDFTGKNACADIHISPDGKYLYGSNRFYDTIVTFSIDEATGKLTQLSQTSVNGKVPRNFTISPNGKFVLVANQETDNIVIFKRDEKTGAITPTGKEIKLSMPVCLQWL